MQELLAEATPRVMLTVFGAIAMGFIFFTLAGLRYCRRFQIPGESRQPYKYRRRPKYALGRIH